MQPVSGPGAPSLVDRLPTDDQPGSTRSGPSGETPMSPAQRATLERLIVRLLAISTLQPAEIRAGILHQAGVKNENALLSRHFPRAEQLLNQRISEAQGNHASRQLLQQLIDLLPLSNNRQAVSDFIRQQFGHTVLSSLAPEQLRQVLTMLQSGQTATPPPQQNRMIDHGLPSTGQQVLDQQIARLASTTGEPAGKIRAAMQEMVNLKSGEPVPARLFPLLTQYLQTRQTLSQHNPPTLTLLMTSLQPPPAPAEQQLLESAAHQQFQAQPHTPLTPLQAWSLLELLFNQRAERLHERPLADSELHPQPIVAPILNWIPAFMQPAVEHPVLSAGIILALIMMLLWIFC